MFKKKPILTAGFCTKLEDLRLALEVLTGHRTRFVHMDFNTGRGRVHLGIEEKDLWVDYFCREDLVEFSLDEAWHIASLNELRTKVKVSRSRVPNERHTIAGTFSMRWVGTSANDRREEPLDLKAAQYCAEVRGLTLEELLNSTPEGVTA